MFSAVFPGLGVVGYGESCFLFLDEARPQIVLVRQLGPMHQVGLIHLGLTEGTQMRPSLTPKGPRFLSGFALVRFGRPHTSIPNTPTAVRRTHALAEEPGNEAPIPW